MKTIKSLLILGLLSITSVSFASSLTYYPNRMAPADGDTVGVIELASGGASIDFSGWLADTDGDPTTDRTVNTSVYYELNILDDGLTMGWANNALQSGSNLVTTFWDGLTQIGADFTGDFSLTLAAGSYLMKLTGLEDTGYSGSISAVPVPAAGILFATVLLGAGVMGRRKKKTKTNDIVSAFTRAS